MKPILFGASGMVGMGVLRECLDDDRVTSVLVIGRTPCGISHAKLRETIHQDFFDFAPIRAEFADRDACFFCLGVSAAGMSESQYRRLTLDLTLAAANALVDANPRLTFCYVSGVGTDSTGTGRVMWARIKGQTENALLALPFTAAFMFRPGLIQPMRGVRTKTRAYAIAYSLLGPFLPLLRRLFPNHITTSVDVGRAMIRVALDGYERRVLEPRDINRVALRE